MCYWLVLFVIQFSLLAAAVVDAAPNIDQQQQQNRKHENETPSRIEQMNSIFHFQLCTLQRAQRN